MPELPAQDTHRPYASDAPSRQITTGQWVAIGGLALGLLALPYRVLTDPSFDLGSVIWFTPISIAVLSLAGWGLARGSRFAFVVVAFMAFAQLTTSAQFLTDAPEFLSPISPIASVVLFAGLWMSRDQFWKRRE
jgi:hypothetical protein